MQRFLVSKTFLKSEDKAFFFNQFSKVETIIKEAGFNIEDLLITDKYKNIYQLFIQIKSITRIYSLYDYDSSKQKYIKR